MKTICLGLVMLFVTNLFAQNEMSQPSYGYLDSIGSRLSQLPNEGLIKQQEVNPCEPMVLLPIFRKPLSTRDSATTPGDIQHPDTIWSDEVEGDINIYWIHGLNGSTESWALPANATEYGAPNFAARKAHCIVGGSGQFVGPAYSENFGISYAADNWDAIAEQQTRHTHRDFIIAHSQGGIVAREWLRKMKNSPATHQPFARGLVTFGTPHGGAMILNQTREELGNQTPAFFNEACMSLASALVIPKINESFITSLLISDKMRDLIVTNACKITSNNLIPLVIDNYHKRTTRDYYVGAPFLTGYNAPTGHVEGLSEVQMNMPVVQFYGVEDEPVMWRFMGSQLNMGDKQYGNPDLYFAYDQDDQLIQKVNGLVNEFTANYQYESSIYDEWSNRNCVLLAAATGPIWFVATLAACKIKKENTLKTKRENMEAYNKAIVWLTNANEYYKTMLIGSRVEHTETYCVNGRTGYCKGSNAGPARLVYDFSITEYKAGTSGCMNCIQCPITYTSGNGTCVGTETTTTTYKVSYSYKENDGVVLVESAKAQLNVPAWQSYFQVKMEHTNHDQMKNSSVTKDALLKLYNGDYGQLFKVGMR